MSDDNRTAVQESNTAGIVIADLADHIEEGHLRAMTATLARILVARALAEHGIDSPGENR